MKDLNGESLLTPLIEGGNKNEIQVPLLGGFRGSFPTFLWKNPKHKKGCVYEYTCVDWNFSCYGGTCFNYSIHIL
jgi:hypothetical protein